MRISEVKVKKTIGDIFTYALLIIFALIIIVPLLWVLTNSFRPDEEIGQHVRFNIDLFLPQNPTVENYVELFRDFKFGIYIINTVLVTGVVTLGGLLINSLAAYAFARFKFPGRDLFFAILILTLMIPGESILLSQYLIVVDLNLIDTFAALILPSLASAMGIFFFRQAYSNFPREIEEAAILDGANKLQIYSRILLPLSVPTMITMTIITVTGQWDSFIWPLTVIRDSEKYTIQIGVNYLFGQFANRWGNIFAAAVITALPMMILFLFLQKYFVAGIATAGLKG